MNPRDRSIRLALTGILFLAAILRLPGLDRAMPELYHDEGSRGVDAYYILKTGADRTGQRWPLFLESFGPGDFTAALTTYLTVPFIAALGRSTVAMRLPDALLGVATVALLYAWLRRQIGPGAALVGAAVLATDPWHIEMCRTAHESGFAPFFMAAALLALSRAGLLTTSQSTSNVTEVNSSPLSSPLPLSPSPALSYGWALLAGFMLAMHTWVYPATRLLTPLLILAAIIAFRRPWRATMQTLIGRRTLVAAAVGLIVGAAPIWLTAISHPEYLAARARATLRIYQGGPASAMLADFGRNWARNISPHYLFIESNEMSQQKIPGVGQHLLAVAPLAAIGLVAALRQARRDPFARFLLAWLVLYPIPAAICHDWNPHPLRTVGGMLVFPIVAAMGADWLLKLGWLDRPRRPRLAPALVAVAWLVNTAYFAEVYFLRLPPYAEWTCQTQLVAAIRFAATQLEPNARFIVTDGASQPYTYAMLFEPEEIGQHRPLERRFMASGQKSFHQVVAWGRWVFLPSARQGYPDAVENLAIALKELRAGTGPVYAIVRACEPIEGKVVAHFEGLLGPRPTQDCEIRRINLGAESIGGPLPGTTTGPAGRDSRPSRHRS